MSIAHVEPSLTQIGYSISDNRVGTAPDGTVVPAVTRIAPVNSALANKTPDPRMLAPSLNIFRVSRAV